MIRQLSRRPPPAFRISAGFPIRIIFAVLASVPVVALRGQHAGEYWQQEVHYRIDAELDDVNHRLTGTVAMTYVNHAPQALDTIYLHLWANAFHDPGSAYARQEIRQGKADFYFADPADRGGYSGLSFRVDSQAVDWAYLPQNPDIAYIVPHRPLAPGDSLLIHTPFTLQIPASFSRLGHVGESYQLTQWYPKPAVYDRFGWRPMPYLDQGEFYADFGSFDVTLTLPANYVVAATGVLQTAAERQFLEQKAAETDDYLRGGAAPFYGLEPFPPSSPERKTIRYTAGRVHDFAWFADKRFRVRRSAVAMPSGRRVDTWVFFTRYEQHLWQHAIGYVDRSLRFFSDLVGEYPYPQATAVQSALSAGAGMEYPMITVIGPAATAPLLDEVITHEIGHNWFYGVLASNERIHPWMDEGLTTYYEQRYMHRYYGETGYQDYLPRLLRGRSALSLEELGYLFQARRHRDQAPDTPSDRLTEFNYVLGAYQKPARAFAYLEAYLGADVFDRLMQGFFRQWQFRHPYPTDLRQYLERETGKDLGWLFDGLLGSAGKMDYAIAAGKPAGEGGALELTLKNKGDIAAPIPVAAMRGDSILRVDWLEGFSGTARAAVFCGDCDAVVLDPRRLTPELYRHNNRWRAGALLPRLEPLTVHLLPVIEDERRTQLFLLPVVAWNNYDKAMLGAALTNATLPGKRFEFALAPLYGLGSRELNGAGHLLYHLYPGGGAVRQLTFGVGGRSFNYRVNDLLTYRLRYARLAPYLELTIDRDPASPFSQRLLWRSLLIREEQPRFPDGIFAGATWDDTRIHELSYEGSNRRGVNPFHYRLALERQDYRDAGGRQHYLRATLEWRQALTYQAGKHIDVRLFAGGFLANTRRGGGRLFPGALNLIARGPNDYRYDEIYFGRTDDEGLWSQQIARREGAFKTPVSSAFGLGRSNNFILALNLKADLPLSFFPPLKPFFDIGYFDNAQPTGADDSFQDQLLWSGGLMLDFFDELVGIYLPLVNSRNLHNLLAERGNIWTRISFSIDFARLRPEAVARNLLW